MAHIVGMNEPIREGVAIGLTLAEVVDMADMGEVTRSLDPEEVAEAGRAGMQEWGLAGVGIIRDSRWVGVALISPQKSLPRAHPLAAGGIDERNAALTLVHIDPAESFVGLGKKLCVGLSRRLRGQVLAIDAQAGSGPGMDSQLTPSAEWLGKMGFEAVRYPVRRYRLSLATMATWMEEHLQWSPRPGIALSGQAALRQ